MISKNLKNINPLVAPLMSLALIVMSSAPFMTYISLRLQLAGFDEKIIGLTHSAFYAGFLIGSLKAENFIRKVGYVRSFAAFSALYAMTILVQGIALKAVLWISMRLVAGISLAAIYIIIESWLLSNSTPKTRGKILSIYMIILYLSQSSSQLLIQIFPTENIENFCIFGAICAISIIPVTLYYGSVPQASAEHLKKNIKDVIKRVPFSFSGAFASGVVLSTIYSFLAIYAKLKGLSPSIIMAVTIAGGFILQWPFGYLSDIFERRKVLIFISLFMSIPSILMIFDNYTPMTTYIFCFLIGGFSFTIYPISITQGCDRFDVAYIPYVIGVMSIAYSTGALIGPTLTSFFMDYLTSGVFLVIALIAILLAITGIYFTIKYPQVIAKEDKTDYITISPAIPLAKELDPRAYENDIKNIIHNPDSPKNEK